MKRLIEVGFSGGIAAIGLLLASCGGPGIELLSNPVPRTAGADLAIGGRNYSAITREVLKEEGLTRQVRKDPAEGIRKLDQRLRETERPELRLAAAEVAINQAFRNYHAKSGEVIGYLLTAIELSEGGLGLRPSTVHSGLVEIYNEGNAELAWLLHQKASGKQRIGAKGPLKRYVLSWAGAKRAGSQPDFYDTLTPANRIKIKGFDKVNVRPGIGGSVVGYRRPTPERRAEDPFMPPHTGYALALAATVKWGSKGAATVVLHDLVEEDTIMIDGKRYPLAGDFTAATATLVNAAPKPVAGWIGMMRPEKEKQFRGLYSMEPYRDDRIPLILVHGLLSTPGTWREVINAAYADEVIRKNYQVLVFFYPTGYGIPENSAALRADLKAYQELYDPQRRNPKMRKMVMVGHSMGCNLTNFQIRDGGDDLWSKFFTKSAEEMNLDPTAYERLKRNIYFKANPDIARVVFVCGPHRGSPISNGWLGRFGANLIRTPFHVVDQLSGNLLTSTTALGRSVLDEPISSINNLEENSPILVAILDQSAPYKPKIHSIIGDRGKGGGTESSDGVVPYWSAHLKEAHTEQFIPTSHTGATNHEMNVEAVRAILYEHVGEEIPASPDSN